jgi:hypothetical protein
MAKGSEYKRAGQEPSELGYGTRRCPRSLAWELGPTTRSSWQPLLVVSRPLHSIHTGPNVEKGQGYGDKVNEKPKSQLFVEVGGLERRALYLVPPDFRHPRV